MDNQHERWRSIRRGAARLRLDTNDAWFDQHADTFEFLTEQLFHIRADLDKNIGLKTAAGKQLRADARKLSGGGMKDLRRVQIVDKRLSAAILEYARRCGQLRGPWTVTLRLGGDWAFLAHPQAGADTLVLRAISQPNIVRQRLVAVRVAKDVDRASAAG